MTTKDPVSTPDPRGESTRGHASTPRVVVGRLRPLATSLPPRRAFPEAHLMRMVDLAPVALCLCDDTGGVVHHNPAAAALWGWKTAPQSGWLRVAFDGGRAERVDLTEPPPPGGTPASDVRPEAAGSGADATAFAGDRECRLERADGSLVDVLLRLETLRDATGRRSGSIVVAQDITDRKRRDRNAELLQSLARDLAAAVDETTIIRVTTSRVGEYLGVDRCGFVENDHANHAIKVLPGWIRGSLTSLAGLHPVGALGDAEWQRTLGSVRLAISDVEAHPQTRPYAENYRTRGIRAYAGAPFSRDGAWVASLVSTCTAPREWAADELGVLDDVVARVWPLIERARTQATLKLITQNAPVVLTYFDSNGRIVFGNRAFGARWGLESSDFVGKHISEVIGRAAFDVVEPHLQRVLAGETVQVEVEMPYRDIGNRYVRISCAPDFDPQGRVRGFLSAVSDLTERRAMEQAVEQSEQRYRELVRALPAALYVCDEAGRLVLYNDAAVELWGRKPQLGAESWGGAHAAYDESGRLLSRREWPLARAYRTGEATEGTEAVIERPDGTRRNVVSRPHLMRAPDGRIVGGVNLLIDITERKAFEASLRDRDERLLLATRSGKLGIWDWDVTHDVITWTDSLYEIHGVSRQSFQPTVAGFAALVHPNDRQMVGAKIESALTGSEIYEAEFRAVRPDGAIVWLFTNARVVRESGLAIRMIGATFDITERKRAELALQESERLLREAQDQLLAHAGELERKVEERTASLREAITQMEEFSYSVSHDLRAPLRAMNGYAEALLEDYGAQLDDTGRDYLVRIQRSSQRMEKLTHDVLRYSRVARSEMKLGPVDLNAVMQDLLAQYAELQAEAADVRVESPLLGVTAHELSLGQCLANLLTNAVKFVAPGVRPCIRVYTVAEAGRVRICVQDNGIGIAPEYQRSLFQIFERVPTSRPYQGTGIGLAIVRKAVEKMGGRYGLDSDGVNGSTFWIELPPV